MTEEQRQPQSRPAGVKHRCRRYRLDRVEQEPKMSNDFFEGSSCHDQNIAAGVIITARDQTVLVSIRAEADDRDAATQSIIDLSGIGPSHSCDHQPWSIKEAPAGEVLS
jgi:hypothetical protein